MGKKSGVIIFLILIMSPFFLSSAPAETNKRVFIIHSYEKNHPCGQPQHEGAVSAMAMNGWEKGKNLDIETFYMETKVKHNTPELIQSQAKKILAKIKETRPDLLITLDDNAFRTIGLELARTDLPVVFSGINVQPETYNKTRPFMNNRETPGYNITGVYEKLHIREAVTVLSNMLDLDTLLVLTDLSPTGRAISDQIELETSPSSWNSPPCTIQSRTLKSWEEFKKAIEIMNQDAKIDAFYLGTTLLKDRCGNAYSAGDIVDYTIKHAIKPSLAINYAFTRMGLFGGASIDFFAMGIQAGKKAGEVLNGSPPGAIPIEDAHRISLVFNLSRAEALGIKIPRDILLSADEVY